MVDVYLRAAQEQLVRGNYRNRPSGAIYDSNFLHWDKRASVRRRPRRLVWPNASMGLFFPPELHPVAMHPLVTARGEAAVERLLLERLFSYLDFTTELENLAVIPVTLKISRGRSGLNLPEAMCADAYKITTDEAWHAQFSDDFVRQVETVTGVRRQPSGSMPPPAFAERLDALRADLPHDVRGVEALLFAIVSETLISGILADIPRDARLPPPVRELVRDHAEDEGRHHVYFRSVLRHLWPALTARERRAVGPLVPAAIQAFLTPDYRQAMASLSALGLSTEEIDQVVTESWPTSQVADDIAVAAGRLTSYFTEVGALDDDYTQESFGRAGLLPSANCKPPPGLESRLRGLRDQTPESHASGESVD